MATAIVINGVTYQQPDQGTPPPWGDDQAEIIAALASTTLQKSGGTFTLTAETDFGGTYGLKSKYYKTKGTNIASAGEFRLANAEVISWRNQANNANLDAYYNDTNQFQVADILDAGLTASRAVVSNSLKVLTSATTTATEIGYVNGVTSAIQTQLNTKLTDPMTTNGDIIIRAAGVPARLGIGSSGQVLAVSGGAPVWTTVAGTGDVVGPATSTDNTVARFDGTNNKTIQGSAVVIDDSANVTGVNNLTVNALATLSGAVIGGRESYNVGNISVAITNSTNYVGILGAANDGRTCQVGMPRAGSIVSFNMALNLWYVSGSGSTADATITVRKNGSDFLSLATQALTTAGRYSKITTATRGSNTFSAGDAFDAKIVFANSGGSGDPFSCAISVTMEVQFDT